MIIDVIILTVASAWVNEMSDLSTSNTYRKVIFQVHCGRWEQANVIDHSGEVLARLLTYNWKKLRDRLGVTHIYLLGVWENEGKIIVNEEGGTDLRHHPYRCPSPFAITNHNVINHELGTANDMDRLLTCLHGVGLKVVVDFVPNHTGLSHSWMTEHTDYYKKDDKGQIKTPFSGDVAELNYENEKVQEEMSRVLFNIASFGFDGVRCDMAHLIPLSFWSTSINRIKSVYANFEWIAEAYSSSVLNLKIQTDLMRAGFDAIYDEPLYRNLKTEKQVERIDNFMGHYSYVLANSPKKWVHYLMNHDDNFPLDSEYFWTWFQLISFLPGWIFQYNGNLWGRTQRLAHHWIEILPEEQTLVEALDENILSWYKWFNEERPTITSIEMDSLVKITWKGVSRTGCCSFRLNSENSS